MQNPLDWHHKSMAVTTLAFASTLDNGVLCEIIDVATSLLSANNNDSHDGKREKMPHIHVTT
jgi:hypothetical protein